MIHVCPQCESKGRSIKPVTFQAQVLPTQLDQITSYEHWRMCTSKSCKVVYFQDDQMIVLGETRQTPFHKSEDLQRFVCFCFEHSVDDINHDMMENKASTIQTSIKTKCKAGHDDCQRKNPQGRCCLGNISEVVRQASFGEANRNGDGCKDESSSCCEPTTSAYEATPSLVNPITQPDLFTSGSALVAAIFSSACCWLPLIAIGLGASSAGVGAFFEAWRMPLLLTTAVLLASAFYFVYRKPHCASDKACEVSNSRLQRTNPKILWLATFFVTAFAFFPEYVNVLYRSSLEVTQAAPTQTTVHYQIKGMTCTGCEGHARKAIGAIPGVVFVAVSYHDARAKVVWHSEPNNVAVADAVAEFGYKVNPLR